MHLHWIPMQFELQLCMPPSIILKNHFSELCKANVLISDDMMIQAAMETLLSVEDVRIWPNHMKKVIHNQKCGAAKADVATGRKKKAEE